MYSRTIPGNKVKVDSSHKYSQKSLQLCWDNAACKHHRMGENADPVFHLEHSNTNSSCLKHAGDHWVPGIWELSFSTAQYRGRESSLQCVQIQVCGPLGKS